MYTGSYRAAVIGHTGRGNYGHGLDLAFAGLPNVRLVAVADPDEAGRARAQQRTGATTAYASHLSGSRVALPLVNRSHPLADTKEP